MSLNTGEVSYSRCYGRLLLIRKLCICIQLCSFCKEVFASSSSDHGSVQARLDLHRHELLKKKLTSVRNLNLADVFGRVTPSAMVLEFEKVSLAEETASVAHMHSVAV